MLCIMKFDGEIPRTILELSMSSFEEGRCIDMFM